MTYSTIGALFNNDISVLNLIILCVILVKVWNIKSKCNFKGNKDDGQK